MHTPATAAIQRRLERWELEHLRAMAAAQAEQIETLQRQLAYAEDLADSWRRDALDLQEELAERIGGAPGLTIGGRLVVVQQQGAAS